MPVYVCVCFLFEERGEKENKVLGETCPPFTRAGA
jgi:hypothetical protein